MLFFYVFIMCVCNICNSALVTDNKDLIKLQSIFTNDNPFVITIKLITNLDPPLYVPCRRIGEPNGSYVWLQCTYKFKTLFFFAVIFEILDQVYSKENEWLPYAGSGINVDILDY